ncbi:MAG: ATP-binding cassette domain-containing protein [Alphaproteobacteria bacterium]|nr:ATP-binding cassette domain-containing protein [Alphaproteobacteria bacterium]
MSGLLEMRELRTWFPQRSPILRRTIGHVRAVDQVDLSLAAGRTLGLVGESGCGKSTLGRTAARLIESTEGTIILDGKDVTHVSGSDLMAFRRRVQMVFQDPYASLNPRIRVGDAVGEALAIHGLGDSRLDRRERTRAILHKVGLGDDAMDRYPHEFSGGQRQRIGIARALILNPEILIADEPVSALDVSVQAQVINLMRDLQAEFGLTYLFIAHDLSVVRHISDEVAIMYLGRIVETGPKASVFRNPRHPYTNGLLRSVPVPDPEKRRTGPVPLAGGVPDPSSPPAGCAFHPRCPYASELCRAERPKLEEVESRHHAACHFAKDLDLESPRAT